MSRMEHHEQNNEQVFPRSARTSRTDGFGQSRSANSRWAAIVSISAKIGCAPQLNEWVKKIEVDTGQRGGITTEMAEKMKALERENRELRQANEILRKASAYFAPSRRCKHRLPATGRSSTARSRNDPVH